MRNVFKVPKQQDEELRVLENQLLPSILLEQLSSVLLGIVNTIVMGMVSTAALAGVGQITSLTNVIFLFFNGLSQGGAVMVAQSIGAKNKKQAEKSFEQALAAGTIVGMLVLAFLFIFKTAILTGLFGACEADVMQASDDYFTFCMFATPMWSIYYHIAGAMRSSGDTKTPMKATVVMNVVNIAASVVLSIMLKMDAMGAGIALTASVAAGCIVCIAKLMSKDYMLTMPNLLKYKPDMAMIKKVWGIGVPISIENLLFQGGRLLVQVFVAGMGTVMISAFQVANSLCNIFQLPLMGAQNLIVTVIGRCTGAGGRQRVYDTLDYFNKKTFTWSLYVGMACCLLSYPVGLIFTREVEVVMISWGLMCIYGIFMPFFSFSFDTPQGFKGAGETRFSLVVGTASMWVFRVFGS
ncbi:MAG: MATE family efflux transporter, partial [Clostridia bacterium]|nr:MATE family efflux transporter [Clostridia bacterium]